MAGAAEGAARCPELVDVGPLGKGLAALVQLQTLTLGPSGSGERNGVHRTMVTTSVQCASSSCALAVVLPGRNIADFG